MAKRPPCGKLILAIHGGGPCVRNRLKGRQSCYWHWLLKRPADGQKAAAADRLGSWDFTHNSERVRIMPKERWPAGERWCSGCQSFVPLFYCSGSRCRACASSASHEARVQKVYGLEAGEYDRLFELQHGRCYICLRKSPSRRLAVDHDHETGEARGLLCPDPERGCNHKGIGVLEANSMDGGLAAARRMVEYLEDPPYARMRRGASVSSRQAPQCPQALVAPQEAPF